MNNFKGKGRNKDQLELPVFAEIICTGNKVVKERSEFFSETDKKNIKEMSKNSSNYSW
jgi:hypothetical protein